MADGLNPEELRALRELYVKDWHATTQLIEQYRAEGRVFELPPLEEKQATLEVNIAAVEQQLEAAVRDEQGQAGLDQKAEQAQREQDQKAQDLKGQDQKAEQARAEEDRKTEQQKAEQDQKAEQAQREQAAKEEPWAVGVDSSWGTPAPYEMKLNPEDQQIDFQPGVDLFEHGQRALPPEGVGRTENNAVEMSQTAVDLRMAELPERMKDDREAMENAGNDLLDDHALLQQYPPTQGGEQGVGAHAQQPAGAPDPGGQAIGACETHETIAVQAPGDYGSPFAPVMVTPADVLVHGAVAVGAIAIAARNMLGREDEPPGGGPPGAKAELEQQDQKLETARQETVQQQEAAKDEANRQQDAAAEQAKAAEDAKQEQQKVDYSQRQALMAARVEEMRLAREAEQRAREQREQEERARRDQERER